MKDQTSTVYSSKAGTHVDVIFAIQTENNIKKSILSQILRSTWNWIKANKWGLLAAFIATALVAGLVFGGIVYYPMVLFMLEAVPYIGIGVAKLAFAASTIPQAAAIVGAIAGGLTAAAITSMWLFVGACKMVFNKLVSAGNPPGGNGAGSAAVHEVHERGSSRYSVNKYPQMRALHSHMEAWTETVSSNTAKSPIIHPQHYRHLHASHAPAEVLMAQTDISANDRLFSMSPGSEEPAHAEATTQRRSNPGVSVGSNLYTSFSPVREPVRDQDAQLAATQIDESSKWTDGIS